MGKRASLDFCPHCFFQKWANPGLFSSIFVFSIQLIVNVQYEMLPMTGFESRTSGIGSDRSTNLATTTAHFAHIVITCLPLGIYLLGRNLFMSRTKWTNRSPKLRPKFVMESGKTFQPSFDLLSISDQC